KLASYRIQAEEAIDLALRKLPRPRAATRSAASRTGELPLPGAEQEPDFIALAREIPLPPAALERIWRRHGARLRDIFRDAGPDDLAPICRGEAVTAAEIRYVVDVEGCRTLGDLFRHAHVGAGPCDGSDCAAPAALLMSELLEWTPEHTRAELEEFRNDRWAERRPVLRGATIAAEEVMRGA